MGTCHCSRCRKLGASSFVFVDRQAVKWVRGRDQVRSFTPPPPYRYRRTFCAVCGTSLGDILSEAESVLIPADTLDERPEIGNRFHAFVAEKPPWYGICDDAQQFAGDVPAGASLD
ncbi:GFA family protein [Pseudohoeflea sp. DP4N28-3]|uniref:GFA family protein n=2 Tax=Pseudohoeflea coraliihabitans TaxID=2860393 RepID=A0ABS6WSG6_9HYPH|nr:GFA family protein [Pseudohoeflea sp. DP4N28-3]MBW3098899.1 GFA family protein [Pseudohoeflea sp. DP4N28-3]